MREITANPNLVVPLGRQGENQATIVKFPVSGWNELYGDGSFSLLHKRSGDAAPYPVTIEYDNGFVIWPVTSADVYYMGYGTAQLMYIVGDAVAKSVMYKTSVLQAIDGGEIPEPTPSWIEEVLEIGEKAEENQHTAEAWAVGKRDGVDVPDTDETYHNNSKWYAGQAGEHAAAAETAQGKAEDAQEAIENLSVSAETVAAGSSASVTKTVDPETGAVNLDFEIPRGDTGYPTDAQVAEATDEWLGENVAQETGYVLDSTLTMSNAAAPADKAGELKTAFDNTLDNQTIQTSTENVVSLTLGITWKNGSVSSNNDYGYTTKIPVKTGDVVIARRNGGDYVIRALCAYSGETVVSSAGSDSQINDYTVPSGIDSVVLTIAYSQSYYYSVKIQSAEVDSVRLADIENDIESISAELEAININIPKNALLQTTTWSSGYITNSGSSGGDATYCHSAKISVQKDDVVLAVPTVAGIANNYRFVCAYNGDVVMPSSGASSGASEFVVPINVDGIIISYNVATANAPAIYIIRNGIYEKCGDKGAFILRGNMADNDRVIFPSNNISKNMLAVFSGTVSTFGSLIFGRSTYSNAIVVTSSAIQLLDADGEVIDTHNIIVEDTTDTPLTIENCVTIKIEQGSNPYKRKVSVSSNGVNATPVELTWTPYMSGYPYIESDGTVIADYTASYTTKDINKNIWIFGDSYLSWSVDRWAGWLETNGYAENVLVNAFGGEAANDNIPAFRHLSELQTPRFAIWACGMNDGSDSNSAPNSRWLNPVKVFLAICETYGIVPILCTIPTVPDINHEKKNTWIRTSEYRYIDFAKAVGANSSGVWYSDMLSSDHVHPSEQGAIALYDRAITDCPELMQTS